jgi:hypothetical protein
VPNKLTDDVVSVSPDLKHKIATATNTLQTGRPGAEVPEEDILNFALKSRISGSGVLHLREHW